MGCCGSQRRLLNLTRPASAPRSAGSANTSGTRPPARQFEICFEYIGQTALTAIGGATGRRYRFDRRGARMIVDARDRPSLAAVPNLRQVS